MVQVVELTDHNRKCMKNVKFKPLDTVWRSAQVQPLVQPKLWTGLGLGSSDSV